MENGGDDWLSERLKPSGPLPPVTSAEAPEKPEPSPAPPQEPVSPSSQEQPSDATPGWLEQLRASTGELPPVPQQTTVSSEQVPPSPSSESPSPPSEEGVSDWLQALRKTGEIHIATPEEKQVIETASDWLERLTAPLQRAEPAPGFEDTFRPLEPEPPQTMGEVDLERFTHPLSPKTEKIEHVEDSGQVPANIAEAASIPEAAPLPFEDIGKDLEQVIPAEGVAGEAIPPEMNMASLFPPVPPEAPASARIEEQAIPAAPILEPKPPVKAGNLETKLPPPPPLPSSEPDILAGLEKIAESKPAEPTQSPEGSNLPFDLNIEELESAPHSVNIEAIPESQDTPDWLQQYAGDVGEIPDLTSAPQDESSHGASVETAESTAAPVAPTIQAPENAPEWLQNIIGNTPSTPGDLFKSVEEPLGSVLAASEEESEQPQSQIASTEPPIQPSKSGRLPDWLTELEESKPVPPSAGSEIQPPVAPEKEEVKPGTAVLSEEDLNEVSTYRSEAQAQPSIPGESAFPEYTPGSDLEDQEETSPELPSSEPAIETRDAAFNAGDLFSQIEDSQPVAETDKQSADWLKSLPSLDDIPPMAHEEQHAAEKPTPEPTPAAVVAGDMPPVPPSPKPDEQAVSSSPFEIAALPDWLSKESDQEGGEGKIGDQAGENLAPAEMPSWLQALKPQTKPAQITATPELDGRLENKGPLAGFTGVIPGSTTPSPNLGDISDALPRLTPSDVQRKYASLMDAVLTEETPLSAPVKHVEARKSRLIRLAATAASILLLLFMIVFGTQILDMPGLFPLETVAFHNTLETLPANSKILVAVDYDPAFTGELRSISQTIIDQLMIKNAGMVFISTLPSGPVLADELFKNALVTRAEYDTELSINLGYLAGGANGLQELAIHPTSVISRAWNRLPAWSQPAVAGINQLSQFDGIILITDSFETGRSWIEQVEPNMDGSPLLIAASAQSSPLFQPYVNSGQVDGLIAGYAGEAAYDQILGIEDGVRIKWDAYMIGQSLMILVILMGAAWNFVRNHPVAGKSAKESIKGDND